MCNICMQSPCLPQCPNYIRPKNRHYCCYCNEQIHDGEEYIKNYDNEYRHYDCYRNTKELLKWLGCEIEIMENDYD